MRLSYNSDGLLVKEQYQTLGEPIQPGIIRPRTQDGIPLVTEYRYDILGNRTQTILPTGETLNYLYYGSGHLHHINLDGDTITDIERDDRHRPVSRSAGKLHTHLISDPLGRLKEQLVQLEAPGGKATELKGLIKRRYHYDTNGNLVQTEDQHHGNKDYAYDPLGRITRAGDERFAFDPAHNISGDGVKVTGNRLTDYNGIRYVYDPLGNLSERHNDATGESQYYRYDADNQLTEARIEQTDRPSEHWLYRYDALGRRVSKQNAHNQTETRFLWEGSRLLQEYSDKATYTYVYTEQGGYEPLAQIVQTANRDGSKADRQILYYHNDQIGIPREMTDAEGNIVWRGEYSGWGKLNNAEGANLKEDVHQPFRLQNQYADVETGLHYNFFRYYDPHCGRFTQQDPIGLAGRDNLYDFGQSDQGWGDPLGLNGYQWLQHHLDSPGMRDAYNRGMGDFEAAARAQ
ncbi:RHS repeat-associated core domain-containing protein, partial [Neisseria sp. 74A18]|uniref:RHS repeat-associated core domain-containing protein n=1 Tax=Neisseria sp. 74A18 TaxID=1696094 RepID=UPI000A61EBC8